MSSASNLKELELPNIKVAGDNFLKGCEALEYIEFPKLEIVGIGFLYENETLKYFNLPNLKFVGDEFWDNKSNLKLVDLPNLKTIGTPLVNTPNRIDVNLQNPGSKKDQKNSSPLLVEKFFPDKYIVY